MGSTDALSIIYRDVIITLFYDAIIYPDEEILRHSIEIFEEQKNLNYALEAIVDQYNWGENF